MSDISNLLLYTFFKNNFTARLLRVSRTDRCYILADIFDSCEQLNGLYLNLESKFTWKKRETFEVVEANTIKIINVKPVPVSLSFCRGSRAPCRGRGYHVEGRGSRVTFFFFQNFFFGKGNNRCNQCPVVTALRNKVLSSYTWPTAWKTSWHQPPSKGRHACSIFGFSGN